MTTKWVQFALGGVAFAVFTVATIETATIETAEASSSCYVYKVRKMGTQNWQYWAAYGESARVRTYIREQAKRNLGNPEVVTIGSYGSCSGKCCKKPGGHHIDMDFGAI